MTVSMDSRVSFRDLLAVAIVKSRHDCKKELSTLAKSCSSLSDALQHCQEDKHYLLTANADLQRYAEEAETALKRLKQLPT